MPIVTAAVQIRATTHAQCVLEPSENERAQLNTVLMPCSHTSITQSRLQKTTSGCVAVAQARAVKWRYMMRMWWTWTQSGPPQN